jgi:hypothetical protein
MRRVETMLSWSYLLGISLASCPYADPAAAIKARADPPQPPSSTSQFMSQFEVDDTAGHLTSDAGGPINDQASLRAGARGSILLEDFILRQKIQHFDHERVCILGHHLYAVETNMQIRFPNELSMLVELVLTEHLRVTEISAISRLLTF